MTPTKNAPSNKHALIDRANATMLLTIGLAAFVITFSLVASKSLLNQGAYQNRVIKAKNIALKQLKENNKNVSSLVDSYKTFASTPVNILEGNPKGSGVKDGDNPKLVLDALPSKYDFPGLTSSLEKLLKSGGYKIETLGGTDDEVAQQNTATSSPLPVPIPFPLIVTTNYAGAQDLLTTLERSIRPIYTNSLQIAASGGQVRVTVDARTYYQPEKTLKIGSKEVK